MVSRVNGVNGVIIDLTLDDTPDEEAPPPPVSLIALNSAHRRCLYTFSHPHSSLSTIPYVSLEAFRSISELFL